jgi:hypothetical protein
MPHSPSRPAARSLHLAMVAALMVAACSAGPAGPAASGPAASGPAATPGDPSTPALEAPPLANVHLDAAHAARNVIGREGGVIETSDARGTKYRLAVPAGALVHDVEILAIPIDSVAGLPGEAVLAGGIHLVPDGLTFRLLAELTITLPAAATTAILPFAYSGDLSEPHRYPTSTAGQSITFGIAHFSGYALLAATDQAISATEFGLFLPWTPPTGPADAALAGIAGIYEANTDPQRDEKVAAILTTWLDTGIQPLVSQFRALQTWDFDGPFGTKENAVREAVLLLDYVAKLLTLANVALSPDMLATIGALEVSAIVHGISVTNTDCAASGLVGVATLRLPNEFYWQSVATTVGVAHLDPTLDLDFVIEHACAQVAFDPNGGTNFPSGITPGQVGTLDLRVGLSLDGGAPQFGVPLDVTITPHGTSPAGVVTGVTTDSGVFSNSFGWDAGAPELRLDVEACVTNLPVCQEAFVVRGEPSEPACPSFTASLRATTQTSTEGVSIDGAYAFPGSAFVNLAGDGSGTSTTKTVWRFHSGGPGTLEAMLQVKISIQDFTDASQQGQPRAAIVSLTGAGPITTSQVGDQTTRLPMRLSDGEVITLTGTVTASATAGTGISASIDFQFVDLPAGAFVEKITCDGAQPAPQPTTPPGEPQPA